MESDIRLLAGLDGGASKTRVRVIDVEGRLVGEGRAGPGSLTLSPELAARNGLIALQEALAGSGVELGACRMACGLAGSRQDEKRHTFERLLRDVGKVDVISDGYAALLGAHQAATGAIVIVGTGSIGLRMDDDGRIHQFGGYGPVVGDEASGNWLGRNAVRAALRAWDDEAAGERFSPSFARALIDLMGGDHESILEWIASADATRFADLVPLIIDHEGKGDPLARELLDDASAELTRLIRQTGGEGRVPTSVFGGLATTLCARLPDDTRNRLVQPQGDAIDGALLRARDLAPAEIYASHG
jgi:glucosamine kinase